MSVCDWCAEDFDPDDPGSLYVPADNILICPECTADHTTASKPEIVESEEVTTPMVTAPGFKFGCDPECFIVNAEGVPVSAAGILPGTKESPHPVEMDGITVHVQVDGMAAEFNTPPAETFSDFNKNIGAAIKAVESFLPAGHTLSMVPAVRFTQDAFDAAPDEAKILGCTPDFDAWTGLMNPPPADPDDPYLRTASGHVHIGWGDDLDLSDVQHIMNCQDLTKQLDWYLGAWSVKMDPDPTRRKLYGKAGAYRPKTYGVEYRVLSNFWITTRERRLVVWNRLQFAIADMRRRFIPDRARQRDNENIVAYINKTERDSAVETGYRFPVLSLDAEYSRF